MTRGKKVSKKLPIKVVKNKKPAKKRASDKEDVLSSYEKLEREKRMIMWSGVTFFMLLVMVFWGYNIRQVFIATNLENSEKESELKDWREMSGEIAEQLGEIKDVIKSSSDEVALDQATSTKFSEETSTTTEFLQNEVLGLPSNEEVTIATSVPEVAGTSTVVE